MVHCINIISAMMLMEHIVAQKSCHLEWGRSNPETSSTRGQFSNHYITKLSFIGALLIMHTCLSVWKDIAIKWDHPHFFLDHRGYKGLLLKERICSLREQILSFKSSPHSGSNTKEKENFFTFFLGICKNNFVLVTPLIYI